MITSKAALGHQRRSLQINLHWSCPWSSVMIRICWFSVIWFCSWLINSAWLVAVVVSWIITISLFPIVLPAVCIIVPGIICVCPFAGTGTRLPNIVTQHECSAVQYDYKEDLIRLFIDVLIRLTHTKTRGDHRIGRVGWPMRRDADLAIQHHEDGLLKTAAALNTLFILQASVSWSIQHRVGARVRENSARLRFVN